MSIDVVMTGFVATIMVLLAGFSMGSYTRQRRIEKVLATFMKRHNVEKFHVGGFDNEQDFIRIIKTHRHSKNDSAVIMDNWTIERFTRSTRFGPG
jgi:hypothetical protein